MTASNLDFALRYRALGMSLIRIKTRSKEPSIPALSCFQKAPADESVLRSWWKGRFANHGIGVIAGDVSDSLICRDFDNLHSYATWAGSNPILADSLPTVVTSRGRHVYLRGDLGQIRDASRTRKPTIHFDGDDLKGELRGSGYSILPPSIHESGHVYSWVRGIPAEIPCVDLVAAGFIKAGACYREDRDDRDNRDDRGEQKSTDAIEGDPISKSEMGSIEKDLEALIEEAIQGTIPAGPGRRNRQVFELARRLKSIPALKDANAASLKHIVHRWHKLALPVIETTEFADTFTDFAHGWTRVQFPHGEGLMTQLIETVMSNPLPSVMAEYESPKLSILVGVCAELQRHAGDSPFFLSCRTAARMLEMEPMTCSRYLRLMETDGVIHVIEKGAGNKASRFRYLPSMGATP